MSFDQNTIVRFLAFLAHHGVVTMQPARIPIDVLAGMFLERARIEPGHPTLVPSFYRGIEECGRDAVLAALNDDVIWESRSAARDEAFMASDDRKTYSYGVGKNARVYEAQPMHASVARCMEQINAHYGTAFNVCVLNRYADERQALGWHSDDSPEQDLDHPIMVVSFGATREIWTRRIGDSGTVPDADRYALPPGSLFIMPGGYQGTHQHRIPKPFGKCGLRISLTFRKLDRDVDRERIITGVDLAAPGTHDSSVVHVVAKPRDPRLPGVFITDHPTPISPPVRDRHAIHISGRGALSSCANAIEEWAKFNPHTLPVYIDYADCDDVEPTLIASIADLHRFIARVEPPLVKS